MAIEARSRPLPGWFTRIRTRQTVLPRFQRFEVWGCQLERCYRRGWGNKARPAWVTGAGSNLRAMRDELADAWVIVA
jgi:hypothetical protein